MESSSGFFLYTPPMPWGILNRGIQSVFHRRAHSSPTFALKAPVYRFRLVLLMVLLFFHARQNLKSLT